MTQKQEVSLNTKSVENESGRSHSRAGGNPEKPIRNRDIPLSRHSRAGGNPETPIPNRVVRWSRCWGFWRSWAYWRLGESQAIDTQWINTTRMRY